MFKRIFTATRITAALLMVVSVFAPIQVAEANGTITKQITVLGTDGQPYAGALVGMSFQGTAGSSMRTNAITSVTTDASGIAAMTFSDTAVGGQITVQPPVGDTTTATYTNYTTDHANNSPLTINLQKSLVRINTLTFDGHVAPAYGGVENGFKEWVWQIRSGITNIGFPTNAAANTCTPFSIYAGDDAIGSYRRHLASKITGSGDTRTVTLYNDKGTCLIESPKVDGVYQLQFNGGNISGNLLSNAGQALSFATNQGYEVQMNAVDDDGKKNYEIASSYSYVRSDGSWDSYVDTATAGKYELTFTGFGNASYPTFSRKYFYVTNANKLSWSADGSNPADTLNQNYNLPNANIQLNFIDTETSQAVPVNIEITRQTETTSAYDDNSGWGYLDGRASLFLENGFYLVGLMPILGGNSVTLRFTVVGGVATLTSSSSPTYSLANEVHTVWLPVNNVKFQLTDTSGNPINGTIDFCPNNGRCSRVNGSANGAARGFVADGTYEYIYIDPSGYENLGGIRLSGSIVNGTLSIIGKSATVSVFAIQLPTANVKLNVTHPTTSSAITNGWIEIWTADSDWDGIEWLGNAKITPQIPGYARGYLPNGRYLLTVNVDQNSQGNTGLAARTYRLTMTSGVPTLTFNGNSILEVDGKFPVSPSAANFEAVVKNLSGVAITDGYFDVCLDLGGGATSSCRGYGFGNNGQVSQSLANGNWIITIRPGAATGMSNKTYTASVVEGVVTIAGASESGGRWVLTGTAPNVSGSFTLASGSLTFTNNQGISLSIQKYNNGNWEWQNGGSWVRSQSYALNISTAGRYRIVASPINFTDLVQSYSNEFWVNGSAAVSTTVDGSYSDSLTAFSILLKAPNLRLKVINPLDNTLLPGGWVSIEKVNGPSRTWISNADIYNSNPGLAGSNITEVGQYLLTVNPPNGSIAIAGLAARQYQLTVEANDSMTVSSGGVPVLVDAGRFVLSPATANIVARVVKADGNVFGATNGKWVSANLQKYYPEKNYWEYSNSWAQADQDGYISLRAESAGTYRLRIEPSGDADSTITYSPEFTVTTEELNTFKKDFGNITLSGPSIKITVATATNTSTPLYNSGIEIRKDGNWLDWANTNRSGVAGINLKSAGTYEFVVNPPGELQGSTSRKSYIITAVQNAEGVVTATAVSGTGVSVSNGITTLLLGTPTLSGTVLAPSPSTATQANSQVYAFNVNTGQEMWQFSTNTNQSGAWAMSLPAGTYKIYAKTPWGTSTYGGSNPSGDVVVNASGVATTVPAGLTFNEFTLRLKAPTWSGVVKNPGDTTVVPNARICLRLSNNWNCVNADSNGAWALSAPAGFTDFTGTNPYLEINDDIDRQFPQKRFDGVPEVNTAIGTSGSNIKLLFENANTQITVTAGGSPVANVWVSAERDGVGWLGGGSTNGLGVAKLNIDAPSTEFRVRVDLNGNPTISSSYTSTTKTFASTQITNGTVDSVFSGSVALSEPNFKVVLREPTSDGSVGSAVPYSWIELFSDTTGSWLGGSSTDANGFASFKLDAPVSGLNNYTITVNPAWNAATNYSRQAYAVAVSPTALTVINKRNTNEIAIQSVSNRSVYPLTLGTPSVTGVVVDPSNAGVANSWVVPRVVETGEYLWQQGVSSRNNGAIGLSLADASYTIEANVPWGSSNVAKSASCAVTVSAGIISTGGSCIQDGATKTVRLALRAPNVTFTLKIGGVPVANANIGIGSGSWNTNAQSDAEGKVSLFVDAPAIRAINNYTTAQPLYVWVDPPYGGSVEMARWDCSSTSSKPICSQLLNVPATGDYSTINMGDVTGVAPNTRIHIVAPGTSTDMPNSWVTVLAFDPAHPEYGKRWLGGGNSNSTGYVVMNLDTSTVAADWKFAVEIYAPWNQRQSFATNLDTNGGNGYSWAQITNLPNMSPATPNLLVTVNTANAIANKYGWIGVEEVNGSNQTQSWLGGYGLNENGISSVYLPASKRFRITAYPGSGKSGARTACIVSTNGSAVVSEVSGSCPSGTFASAAVLIALDGGNVVGLVTDSAGLALVGAVVYANESTAVDESTAVITATGADGRYGLQLDPLKTWNIKIFPTGVGATGLGIGSRTGVVPPSSGSITRDFTIANA